MAEDGHDSSLDALWRLLAEAASGGQAKVDAIVALSQRTLFVGTWKPHGEGGFRTLQNSNGQTALPVFTTAQELQESARRFAWFQPDGSLNSAEVGARQALRHVVEQQLAFLVVDIATEHSLEVEREELEPLVKGVGRSDSQGPYAGVGRISSEMIRRVRPTPPPMQAVVPPGHEPAADPLTPPANYGEVVRRASSLSPAPEQGAPAIVMPPMAPPPVAPPPVAPPPVAPAPPAPTPMAAAAPGLSASTNMVDSGAGVSASFGAGSSVEFRALDHAPSDELLDALSAVLRGYPEVEWAVFANVARGPVAAVPTVGLRVDTSFRTRVGEIIPALKQAADAHGATVDVLLLDDPKLMRAARAGQLVFFPWRRRTT